MRKCSPLPIVQYRHPHDLPIRQTVRSACLRELRASLVQGQERHALPGVRGAGPIRTRSLHPSRGDYRLPAVQVWRGIPAPIRLRGVRAMHHYAIQVAAERGRLPQVQKKAAARRELSGCLRRKDIETSIPVVMAHSRWSAHRLSTPRAGLHITSWRRNYTAFRQTIPSGNSLTGMSVNENSTFPRAIQV